MDVGTAVVLVAFGAVGLGVLSSVVRGTSGRPARRRRRRDQWSAGDSGGSYGGDGSSSGGHHSGCGGGHSGCGGGSSCGGGGGCGGGGN